MNLFEYSEAQAAKDAGMAKAEINANVRWSALMLKLTKLTCREQLLFTSDDVFDRFDAMPRAERPITNDARAFGAVMKKAAREGYCEKTNTIRDSVRPSLHASPRAVWRSKLYGGK